jgi:hypothetical protein
MPVRYLPDRMHYQIHHEDLRKILDSNDKWTDDASQARQFFNRDAAVKKAQSFSDRAVVVVRVGT